MIDVLKNINESRWTHDGLTRRILDYGIVKVERVTNLVCHYFRKFCPKKPVTLDSRMVQLHHVKEHQEEEV